LQKPKLSPIFQKPKFSPFFFRHLNSTSLATIVIPTEAFAKEQEQEEEAIISTF
jgi:hypothetical protein